MGKAEGDTSFFVLDNVTRIRKQTLFSLNNEIVDLLTTNRSEKKIIIIKGMAGHFHLS